MRKILFIILFIPAMIVAGILIKLKIIKSPFWWDYEA